MLNTLSALLLVVLSSTSATAALRVVTSTPNLASITRSIAGEHAEVDAVMKPHENVHNVRAIPSHMMRLKRADLFIHAGLDGEPWVPPLLKGARNADLLPGASGNVSTSTGIELLEVPSSSQLSRAHGDIHVYGNTHYLLDPHNAIIVARTIADALSLHDPSNTSSYESNYVAFVSSIEELVGRLLRRLAEHTDAPVIVHHRTWSYFLQRFNLLAVAEIEPKPGITPGPQHIGEVIEIANRENARLVLLESYSNRRAANRISRETDVVVVVMAHQVGQKPEIETYTDLFEHNVQLILEALARGAGEEG
jgi:zinc/manganese transport system substrate-binding protein